MMMENPKITCCDPPVAVKALYLVAAMVQEQSHIEFVWASYKACVDIAYACLLCAMIRVRVCKCVRVCVLVCWNPKFHLFVRFALLVAAAVSCRLYHRVPQPLKLDVLWQMRYNSSRLARLCEPVLTGRVLT